MWARLDDAILDNPKIIAAGPLGFALHVAAITWCARNLTDGFIPKRRVPQLLDLTSLQVSEATLGQVRHGITADDIARDLSRLSLWHDHGVTWELHDYLVYNPSRAQVIHRREREKNRIRSTRCNPVARNTARSCVHPVPVPVSGSSERSEGLLFIAPVSRAPSARARPKTSWPDGFELTEERAAYASRQGLDAKYEWGKFHAHALRDDRRHCNWDQAWRYWVRNAWELAGRR